MPEHYVEKLIRAKLRANAISCLCSTRLARGLVGMFMCLEYLSDDSVAEGTLDEKGFARVEGFEKGTCKVCLPNLDKEAWENI